MSAPRPPRRVSPAVYRRRRLVVGVGALAIIIALVLIIVKPGSGAPNPTPSPTNLVPTATSTVKASATPTPTSTGIDVSKLAACDPELMEITPLVDGVSAQAYGSTAKPALSFSIKYIGGTECYYNVGTNAQVFTIKSGAETYWKSTDCQTGGAETLAIFKPGQTEKSAPFAWSRTLSPSRAGGTCDAKSPAVPRPASYNLSVDVGAAKSGSTAQMILN